MDILKPHRSNTNLLLTPKLSYELISKEILSVKFMVQINESHTEQSFNTNFWDNWGLWNFDVFEVFIQRESRENHYLELQVSPLSQKFALLVEKPRETTHKLKSINSRAIGSFEKNLFGANFEIAISDIPGDGNLLKANFHCILGPENSRQHFSLNPNTELKPDFHRPDLFLTIGEL